MESESNIDHQLVSSGEFLTFILGDEEYGVDILSVQGIQGWTGIQRNPELSNEQVDDFVEGLISIDEKMVIILDINKLASEWSLDLDQQESAA